MFSIVTNHLPPALCEFTVNCDSDSDRILLGNVAFFRTDRGDSEREKSEQGSNRNWTSDSFDKTRITRVPSWPLALFIMYSISAQAHDCCRNQTVPSKPIPSDCSNGERVTQANTEGVLISTPFFTQQNQSSAVGIGARGDLDLFRDCGRSASAGAGNTMSGIKRSAGT